MKGKKGPRPSIIGSLKNNKDLGTPGLRPEASPNSAVYERGNSSG